jgi:membrane protein implicated in regulation of membrane protease activity
MNAQQHRNLSATMLAVILVLIIFIANLALYPLWGWMLAITFMLVIVPVAVYFIWNRQPATRYSSAGSSRPVVYQLTTTGNPLELEDDEDGDDDEDDW